MKNLEELSKYIGRYKGEGINHENQPFIGILSLDPVLNKKGFEIKFKAVGKDGTVYHEEKSIVAPSIDEKLCLWNFNSNTPGLVPHALKSTEPRNGSQMTFVFGFNDINDKNAFREEVALDLWANGEVSYTYSWGLPGGEFKVRSGVKMSPSNLANVNHVITMVEDMNRSVSFYRDKIGLQLKFQSDNWTEFDAGGITLALHGGGKQATGSKNSGDPHSSIAGVASVSFDVPDVKAVYQELNLKGVKFTLEPTARQNEGIMLAVAEDPDGFELCFAQRLS